MRPSSIVARFATLKRTVRTHDGRVVTKSYFITVYAKPWAMLTNRTISRVMVRPGDWLVITGNAT